MKRFIRNLARWWFQPIPKEHPEMTKIEEIKNAVFKNVPQERREREVLSARLTMIEVSLKNMARR